MRQVTLDGDVNMQQEGLSVASQTLALAFDPTVARASTQPSDAAGADINIDLNSLRNVIATGDVRATGLGKGPDDSLSTGRLELGVGPSDVGPAIETMVCSDGAKFVSKGRSLSATNVEAKLKPIPLDRNAQQTPASDDPLDQILSMNATGNVVLDQGAKGSSKSDRLTIGDVDGQRIITLIGAPAVASGERGTLSSERIELNPVTGNLRVPQAGGFTGSQVRADGSKRDVQMNWTGYMTASSRDGVATISQGVTMRSRDDAGATLDATAGKAIVRFTAEPPSTQPSTTGQVDPTDAFKIQSLETVDLFDDVKAHADGGDKRTAVIEAPHVHYDDLSRDVTIDAEGRMLVSDLRDAPATKPATGGGAFSRGTLALTWKKGLNWNARDGDLTATGGVRLGFERASDPDDLGVVRLSADRMIGRLRPVNDTAKKPDANANMLDSVVLESMRFDGDVRVRSNKVSFDAARIDYDAPSGIATATAHENERVEFYLKDGVSKVAVSSLKWNVVTGTTELKDFDGRLVR
ncbi:MAG: hypothetical protein QM770_18105 [Tepidisphaeraceae bacterium]